MAHTDYINYFEEKKSILNLLDALDNITVLREEKKEKKLSVFCNP